MGKYDFDLRDCWRIIRRRKKIIVIITLLISSSSFLFAKLKAPPPRYEATAAVKFERSISVTGLFIETISYSTGDPLATQAIIIKSGPVMEKVAKELGLIDPKFPSDQIRQSEKLSRIIANLQDQVEAEQVEYTNVINITATAPDPKMAQRLANTVATVYREQNIAEKNRQIKEARSFIEEQLKVIGGHLKNAEERLRTYKEQKRLVALDQQVTSALMRVANLESDYEKVNRRIEKVSSQLSKLRKGVESPFKTSKVFLEDISPNLSKLNTDLLNLMVRRDALLLNYTKKSPQVQELEGQIKDIKANIARALSSTLKTLEKERESLDKQLRIFRNIIKDIPQEHLELIRLQREVKVNEDLFSTLKSKYQEALIKEAEQVEEVVIVRPALQPTKPVNSPKTLAITFVGMVIGSILGLTAAITFETLDTSIGTIEDVEEFLGIPVLGVIPYTGIQEVKETLAHEFSEVKDGGALRKYAYLITHFVPKSHLAESYRSLGANIQLVLMGKGIKTMLITSSSPLEGKTATIINLAISMAQAGKNTLLIESDLRKPRISRNFGIEGEPGLTEILLGSYKWTEVTRTVSDIMLGKMTTKEIMLTPGMENLSIIPYGLGDPTLIKAPESPRMKDFIDEVKEKYDIVLLDSPPVLTAADAAIMSTYADGVIIVYQVGKVARGALRRTKAQLEGVKAKVMGVVLNGVRPEISVDYETLKYGYYYYKEKEKKGFRRYRGAVLPALKGFWGNIGREAVNKKKDQKEQERVAQKERSGWFRVVILILSLAFLIGGIVWQQYWREKTQRPSIVMETEQTPQKISKMPSKKPAKSPNIEQKETNSSRMKTKEATPQKTVEATPEQAAKAPILEVLRTPRKAMAKTSGTEQKRIDSFQIDIGYQNAQDRTEQKKIDSSNYPYSIHISSYSTQRGALADLKKLEERGHHGYLSWIDLLDKGIWHRVFIGPFKDEETAKEYLKGLTGFPGARVRSIPFALMLGSFHTQQEALEKQRKLSTKGYFSYILPTHSSDEDRKGFRVLIGAFYTKDQAEIFWERLRKDGLEAQVVVR